MFKENKYTKLYYKIISNSKHREWKPNQGFERHHIIPKSFGGSNEKINIAILTCREHFIIHKLLIKMCIDKIFYRKMCFALHRIINNGKFSKTSKEYEKIRILAAKAMSEHRIGNVKFTDDQKKLIGSYHKGKVMSIETREKMSKSGKGKRKSTDTKKNVSNGLKIMWEKRKLGIIPYPKNSLKYIQSLSGLNLENTGNRNEYPESVIVIS